jgi:flagellar assembly factor FliW
MLTSRFGTIDIEEEQIISVPYGIIGFPDEKRFVLLEHKKGSPFFWFQSVDNPSLAFALMDPLLFKPDYEIEISPEDTAALELKDTLEGIQTLVIINISNGKGMEVTANLLGPIIINVQNRLAKQIVLYQHQYSHRHPIPLLKNGKAP